MKNLIFLILLFLFTFFLKSCGQNSELGKDNLNLEKFDINFSVEKFYSNEIEKEKKYEEQKDVIIEKIQKNKYTEKEIEKFDEMLSELNDFKWIKIDTIYSGEKYYDNIGKPIGIQYNMRSWSPNDSLSYYDKMYFEKINMMKSLDGNFMALVATNESNDENSFKQLLKQIELKNGKARVLEDDFFGSYYVYFWELEDRLLAISSKYDDKNNTLKLGIEIDLDKIKVDTTKHSTTNTKLFILNNKFKQDSILQKLNSDDWLYFKEILDNKKIMNLITLGKIAEKFPVFLNTILNQCKNCIRQLHYLLKTTRSSANMRSFA